jgi:hypothetical protein
MTKRRQKQSLLDKREAGSQTRALLREDEEEGETERIWTHFLSLFHLNKRTQNPNNYKLCQFNHHCNNILAFIIHQTRTLLMKNEKEGETDLWTNNVL